MVELLDCFEQIIILITKAAGLNLPLL